MRILLIEDDEPIANLLSQALVAQHYLVEIAADGQAGWDLAQAFEYDLILLDLRLPKLDGISFCQRLRHQGSHNSRSLNSNTPILLMTAEDVSANRVTGLDSGADDYIVKPFNPDELLARVRALLRRGRTERSPLLRWGNLQIAPSACQVSYQGKPFHLSSKEYRLLELFLRHPQQIFSHGALIEHLWALEDIPTENAVRAQIKGLRKKLKEVGVEDCIETIYGLGYRLKQANKLAEPREETDDKPIQKQQQISTFWQQYQSQYCDRLSVIEQAIFALQKQILTADLRQQAKRETHTLKGSLGLFGLDHAFELLGQIEQVFQTDSPDQQQQVHWVEWLSALRQILEHPLPQHPLFPIEPSTVKFISEPSSQQLALSCRSRLLVVDDDVQLLSILQTILQPWGFQVTLLDDPQHFWSTLKQVSPDLLLLDIEMPECNGIDLCQRIRSDSHWGDLPILMISASNDDCTIQQVFMAGADDYVSKPIRAAELVARVTRRLEHAKLLKKLRGLED